MQFIFSSIENLSAQWKDKNIIHLSSVYFDDHLRKVYCYDYINSMERIDKAYLPSKADFYNKLNDSDEEYTQAKLAWDTLEW